MADGDGNHGGFARTGLSLSDDVASFEDRHHSSLLNLRRFLETVVVDSAKNFIIHPHLVETRYLFDPFGRFEDKILVIQRSSYTSPVAASFRCCHGDSLCRNQDKSQNFGGLARLEDGEEDGTCYARNRV